MLYRWIYSHDLFVIFSQDMRISKLNSAVFTDSEYEVNSNKSAPEKKNFAGIHNCNNVKLRLIANSQNDTRTIFENYYENYIRSRMKTNPSTSMKAYNKCQCNVPDTSRKVSKRLGSECIETSCRDEIIVEDLLETNGSRSFGGGKTETSAGRARSDGGTRNTDTLAERIREKRDNNPHQRELGEVKDKNQQDRRLAQRDVQEETNRSQIAAEKKRGGRDTEDAMTEEEEEEEEKEKSGDERRNPGKNSYQQRSREECETRLPDNSAEKIDRLDRVKEKSVTMEISRKPAKRLEQDEHGRRDRHENEENSIAPAPSDRKKEKEDKDEKSDTPFLSKNKGPGSKRTSDSVGDAEKGRSALNEEGKFPASNRKRKGASTDRENETNSEARKPTTSKCKI